LADRTNLNYIKSVFRIQIVTVEGVFMRIFGMRHWSSDSDLGNRKVTHSRCSRLETSWGAAPLPLVIPFLVPLSISAMPFAVPFSILAPFVCLAGAFSSMTAALLPPNPIFYYFSCLLFCMVSILISYITEICYNYSLWRILWPRHYRLGHLYYWSINCFCLLAQNKTILLHP